MLWLRDKAGVEFEEYVFEKPVLLKDLIEEIKRKHSGLSKLLDNVHSSENPIIILVNGVKQDMNYILRDGDEVVFLPPVSGG